MDQQQLELPPISFARYLELLKRRKWQVIPMSLLGLIVGGFVAFLIPRYYVATTVLTYQGSVQRDPNDPLLPKVSNAPTSLHNAVPDALMELARIGNEGEDPDRQDVIDEVDDRLTVQSYQVRDRGYWNINIEYKDTDGEFAADFANAVRDAWVEQIKAELAVRAERELEAARSKAHELEAARDNALRELRNFTRRHGIDGLAGDPRLDKRASLEGRLGQHRAEQTRLEGDARGLRQRIKSLDDTLKLMEPEVEVPIEEDAGLVAELQPLLKRKAELEYAIQDARDSHPSKRIYRAWLASVDARLQELIGSATGGRTRAEPNPEYRRLERERADARRELESVEARLEVVDEAVTELEAAVAELPEIFHDFEALQNRYDDARAQHERALEDVGELERIATRARQGDPIVIASAARVPEVPTEPNITLVAIAGALVGLAAAIGLVLLLDFLRSTFKTIEDVQYALKVPVLGMMAYIETSEDRLALVRHRRRVTLVAASFLVVSVSLLTIYYVAPTQLPPSVLEALHTILGPGQ